MKRSYPFFIFIVLALAGLGYGSQSENHAASTAAPTGAAREPASVNVANKPDSSPDLSQNQHQESRQNSDDPSHHSSAPLEIEQITPAQ